MLLTLIRHSKTKPTTDIPNQLWGLTDEGIELAKRLSQDQSIKTLDVLYTSLQTKAIETALYLAKPNSIPIKTNDCLREITSFVKKIYGEEQYEQNVKDFFEGRIERFENGESMQDALDRFLKTLEVISTGERTKGFEHIGLISHGSILSLFSSKYSNYTAFDLHHKINMPDLAVFDWDSKQFTKFWGETL